MQTQIKITHTTDAINGKYTNHIDVDLYMKYTTIYKRINDEYLLGNLLFIFFFPLIHYNLIVILFEIKKIVF